MSYVELFLLMVVSVTLTCFRGHEDVNNKKALLFRQLLVFIFEEMEGGWGLQVPYSA